MALNFLVQLVIGVALSVVGYLLMPKPKPPKPPAVKDMDDPTAEAGRPVPVTFGTISVSGLNILWYGDKDTDSREVDAGGGKK